MPYTCWFLWQAYYIEDIKWRLHFQFGVAFWRVVLREVYFEGPNRVWRALKTSILDTASKVPFEYLQYSLNKKGKALMFPCSQAHPPITIPNTFPCSHLAKICIFCNFGTPKSPKMFNMVLRVNEWRNYIKNKKKQTTSKRVSKSLSMQVSWEFSKKATAFLTSPTFSLLYSYLDLFRLWFSLD